MSPTHMLRAAFAGAAIVLSTPPGAARSQAAAPELPDFWGTNGVVSAVAPVGNSLVLGGGFTTVGPNTGGGVPVDRATGAPRTPFARVNGRVSAVVSDGAGGWFIGGHFTAVEGASRRNLAHVLADGSVADWNPAIEGVDGYVLVGLAERRTAGVGALVLKGNTLYVGGRFTSACGQPRTNLAAVDATTGVLAPWDPAASDEVWCLTRAGNTLYVGGEFLIVGGVERHHIAALDLRSGRPTAWDPNADNRVRTIAIDGHTVYAGGDFDVIGGQRRTSIAALDAATGQASTWDADVRPRRRSLPHSDWIWPFVSALATRGHTLYVGGWFDSLGAEPRRYAGAFDTRSGTPTAFAPAVDYTIGVFVPVGNLVYTGGGWYHVGDAAIPHVAAFDATTGQPTAWNPRANGVVEALAVDATSVYVGGSFQSLHDWQLRSGLAALDLATGKLTDWNPEIDGYGFGRVAALGDTVYVSGGFRSVSGQPRGNLAAIDARTGIVTSWNPANFGIGGQVMRAEGGRIFVSGHWSGAPRFFASLDPVTAAPAPFDAQLDGPPDDFAYANGALYLAGDFVHAGGGFRPYLAAVDATSGQLLPWNPEANPDERVFGGFERLLAHGNTIYAGGNFDGPPWFPRSNLAAIDATTGALLPWDPHPTSDYWNFDTRVRSLVLRGSDLWVGGHFLRIGDEARCGLAVVDATTGALSPVDFGLDGDVYSIVPDGGTMYVGGSFRSVRGYPQAGVMAIPATPTPLRATAASPNVSSAAMARLTLGPCRPSPLRSGGVIAYTLPRAALVHLAVYDLQGRRTVTLLEGARQPAGSHEVTLSTAHWRPGVYFCRIEAAGHVATSKVLVVD